jgi:vanillate monooxygenase ferredoxin subunit
MAQLMRTVKVSAKTVEADDVTSFELVATEGAMLPPFSAGSHIDVEIKTGLVRQYSLCNDPREKHRYLIGVLREPNSQGGSIAMVDNIAVGDEIKISEPRNNFALEPTAKRVLLLAGGIGITPILCMAEGLAHDGTPFEMHYCARSHKRAAFLDRIASSSFADSVQFHFDDHDTPIDLDRVLAQHEQGRHLYVCGPKGFIDAVLTKAKTAGWVADTVHREFFTPADNLRNDGEKPFEIEIFSTGERLKVAPDKSVADVLGAHGFDIPLSCEQGICGTCITRVIKGTPDHRDVILTDDEKAKNDQFAPCCSRSISEVLVLDL